MEKLSILEWWGTISGFASVLGLGLAAYFYWKQKRTDQVVAGFYRAIAAESASVLGELTRASQISNPDQFHQLRERVFSTERFMASLNHTISVFQQTLWPRTQRPSEEPPEGRRPN